MNSAKIEVREIVRKAEENVNKSAKEAKKELKEVVAEEKLAEKIVNREVEDLIDQERIVSSLLNGDRPDNTAGMYAESWNKPTYFASPEDETVPNRYFEAENKRKNEGIYGIVGNLDRFK